MDTFLLELLCVSERAATIARLCRAEKTLFELLVEEKTGDGRNKRFHHDFKTLADVLIQETVRHYIGRKVGPQYKYSVCADPAKCLPLAAVQA